MSQPTPVTHSENRCRYCGNTIVWTESRGWQQHTLGTIIWGTERCSSREANPDAGHALPERSDAGSD
jgi:hypothetical protein